MKATWCGLGQHTCGPLLHLVLGSGTTAPSAVARCVPEDSLFERLGWCAYCELDRLVHGARRPRQLCALGTMLGVYAGHLCFVSHRQGLQVCVKTQHLSDTHCGLVHVAYRYATSVECASATKHDFHCMYAETHPCCCHKHSICAVSEVLLPRFSCGTKCICRSCIAESGDGRARLPAVYCAGQVTHC